MHWNQILQCSLNTAQCAVGANKCTTLYLQIFSFWKPYDCTAKFCNLPASSLDSPFCCCKYQSLWNGSWFILPLRAAVEPRVQICSLPPQCNQLFWRCLTSQLESHLSESQDHSHTALSVMLSGNHMGFSFLWISRDLLSKNWVSNVLADVH